MKLIKAVVKPHKLENIHEALVESGVTWLTAREVKAFDKQMHHAELMRGKEFDVGFMPMVEIEVIVEDDNKVGEVKSIVRQAAATGDEGDGKIFSCDIHMAKSIHER